MDLTSKNDNTFDIVLSEDFTPQIQNLVALLNLSKTRIYNVVKSLSIKQLDFYFDNKSNSIGALLKHMAALEEMFRISTFHKRSFKKTEQVFWHDALSNNLSQKLIKGNPISYYTRLWDSVRDKTINDFKKEQDSWLYEHTYKDHNNYFCWFHVMEDHICHLGQIKIIIKRYS